MYYPYRYIYVISNGSETEKYGQDRFKNSRTLKPACSFHWGKRRRMRWWSCGLV